MVSPTIQRATAARHGHAPEHHVASLDPGDPGEPRPSARSGLDELPPLGYVAGLDGIRAIAIATVLLFHHDYDVVRGGFLGVSTFFTLSGFLIASLTLAEWANTGRLSIRHFYERRARRLLPALLVTLIAVAILRAYGNVGESGRFLGDVLSSFAYVTNWRFVYGTDAAELFSTPSPVLHLWSLAIEEQFYIVFPVVFAGTMTLARRIGRRRTSHRQVTLGLGLATFVGLTAVACGIASILWAPGKNLEALYYSTHIRVGEILTGVTLAFVVRTRPYRRLAATRLFRLGCWVGGCFVLAAMVLVWHVARLDGARLFDGVTLINSLLTCLLIVAIQRPGPVAAVFGSWPLRSLGKISYAAYLFHWPVYLFTASRYHLTTWWLFSLRVVITLALATLSYHFIESPIRFRLRIPKVKQLQLLGFTAVATLVLAVAAAQRPIPPVDWSGFELPESVVEDLASRPDPPVGEVQPSFTFLRMQGIVTPVHGQVPRARVLLVGDAMSTSFVTGFDRWNKRHPNDQLWIDTYGVLDCSIQPSSSSEECADWHEHLTDALTTWHPDVVFVVMGRADLAARGLDPAFDTALVDGIGRTADALTSQGTPVVWATYPHLKPDARERSTFEGDLEGPARVDELNRLLVTALSGRSGVTMVDLEGWTSAWPRGEYDERRRSSDGNLGDPGSRLAGSWLVPQLLTLTPPGPERTSGVVPGIS